MIETGIQTVSLTTVHLHPLPNNTMSQVDFLLANNAAYVAKGEVPKVALLGSALFVPKGEVPPAGRPPGYAVGMLHHYDSVLCGCMMAT